MTFSLNINNICMYNISLYLSYALILNIFNSHFVAPLDGHRSGCPGCQHSISKSYTSLNRSHLSLRRICLRCKAHTYMYFLRFIFFFFTLCLLLMATIHCSHIKKWDARGERQKMLRNLRKQFCLCLSFENIDEIEFKTDKNPQLNSVQVGIPLCKRNVISES